MVPQIIHLYAANLIAGLAQISLHRYMDSKIDLSESGIEDSGPEEVLGRGEGVPNSRIVKLEEEAFLESLKQYKHVQPRIGKEIFTKKIDSRKK